MNTEEIRETFKGYHVEINLFPSGGMVTLYGCDECGTNLDAMETITYKTDRGGTIEGAVAKLKAKLDGNISEEQSK